MNSEIIKPYPSYPLGALSYPKAVRYGDGKTFAKATNGVIYHVAARINGYYPIRHVVGTDHAEHRIATQLFAVPLPVPYGVEQSAVA